MPASCIRALMAKIQVFRLSLDTSSPLPWPWPWGPYACISLFIVTDAHDSNYHVDNVNKIPYVNDFTYMLHDFTLMTFLLLSDGFRAPWLFIWVHSCCSCHLGSGRVSSFSKCGLIVRPQHAKMSHKLLESLAFATVRCKMPFKLFTLFKIQYTYSVKWYLWDLTYWA